tara:strand:- start:274 stop:711 length:438 start_codon:yes stop_codon:yes gene_type:complete
MRKFGLILFLLSANLYTTEAYDINLSCELKYRTVCIGAQCQTFTAAEDNMVQPSITGLTLKGRENFAILTIDDAQFNVEKKGNVFKHIYEDIEYTLGPDEVRGDISSTLNVITNMFYTEMTYEQDGSSRSIKNTSNCLKAKSLLD